MDAHRLAEEEPRLEHLIRAAAVIVDDGTIVDPALG
jgi:hypothetical protein